MRPAEKELRDKLDAFVLDSEEYWSNAELRKEIKTLRYLVGCAYNAALEKESWESFVDRHPEVKE